MAKHPNDDLFEGTSMTFGEHLEELRSRILLSLVAVGVVFCLAFWQQDRLMDYFTRPHHEARESIRAQGARAL